MLQGPGAYAFKGFTSIIASALILWLSFALLKFMVRIPTLYTTHVCRESQLSLFRCFSCFLLLCMSGAELGDTMVEKDDAVNETKLRSSFLCGACIA